MIEDNPGDAFLIKFYLGESMTPKFDFHHADTIKAANEFLSNNFFDIVLMDLNLPDSVGIETIKQTLEKYPNNLVIVLTGLVDERVGLETVRYGAQDFLVKGKFDGKVLISSIMFAFERFNLNKELSSVSSELNKGEERFANIQMLMSTGYIEVDFETNIVYQSPHLLQLLNMPADKQHITIDEARSYIENHLELKAQAQAMWENKEIKVLSLNHKMHTNGPLLFKWQVLNEKKLIGVIYPA